VTQQRLHRQYRRTCIEQERGTAMPELIRAGQLGEKLIQIADSRDGFDSSSNSDSPSSNGPKLENIFIPENKTNQVTKRGWSLDSIKEVMSNPALVRNTSDNPSVFNQANGNPVTYYYRSDGNYVVIDDITGQVVQVSDTFDPR
jgi:Colicin E5 ribonuclease domain